MKKIRVQCKFSVSYDLVVPVEDGETEEDALAKLDGLFIEYDQQTFGLDDNNLEMWEIEVEEYDVNGDPSPLMFDQKWESMIIDAIDEEDSEDY